MDHSLYNAMRERKTCSDRNETSHEIGSFQQAALTFKMSITGHLINF